MNIRKKKQKHIKKSELAYKPTLRQTIRQLLKMFAKRKLGSVTLLAGCTCESVCMDNDGIPIPEGYSKLEDVLARSKARREEKNNANNE